MLQIYLLREELSVRNLIRNDNYNFSNKTPGKFSRDQENHFIKILDARRKNPL